MVMLVSEPAVSTRWVLVEVVIAASLATTRSLCIRMGLEAHLSVATRLRRPCLGNDATRGPYFQHRCGMRGDECAAHGQIGSGKFPVDVCL